MPADPLEDSAENHDRWLVSYADFITLLCAFFILLFASSQADRFKAKKAAESVRKGFEQGFVKSKIAAVLGGTVDTIGPGNALRHGPGGGRISEKEYNPPELHQTLETLSDQLKEEIAAGRIRVSMEGRGLVVSMQEATFFATGDDQVAPTAFPSLEKLCATIRRLGNPVRLEGHTDSVPIHTGRFRNNWDLSVARSIAVLEVMSGRFGIPQNRLAVAGYADTFPVESNDTERGRARNRRVDMVILNTRGALIQPAPSQAQ